MEKKSLRQLNMNEGSGQTLNDPKKTSSASPQAQLPNQDEDISSQSHHHLLFANRAQKQMASELSSAVAALSVGSSPSSGKESSVSPRTLSGCDMELSRGPSSFSYPPGGEFSNSFIGSTTTASKNLKILQPPKKRKDLDDCCQPLSLICRFYEGSRNSVDSRATRGSQKIDLSEWKGQRILAKKGTAYWPGVIKDFQSESNVGILFDEGREVHYYPDVLESRSFDVVSDYSPPANAVGIGALVCVRIDPEATEFYAGRVIDKKHLPAASYLVALDAKPDAFIEDSVWVSRANLRLLLPPWFEDLYSCQPEVGPSGKKKKVPTATLR